MTQAIRSSVSATAAHDSEAPSLRVLVICDRYPYPLYNGQNLRIFHYVRHLSKHHRFDLLCYGDGDAPEEIRDMFGSIRAFPAPKSEKGSLASRLGTAFRPSQMMSESPEFRAHLAQRLACDGYDLVWMSGWDTVISVPRPCPVPLLADIVDDGVLEHWREFKSRHGLRRRLRAAKRLIDNILMERYFFAPADACLVVSERDAGTFSRVCPRTPVRVIQNGVDEEIFRPLGGAQDSATVIFEGSMEFPPNVDAARYLVTEILPIVKRQVPQVRVVLVGRDPAPEVKALASENVQVTGFVDDVRPYLDSATIFVCPMRKGAGIKNKLLQAWSMGKPVVASATATGGLEVREGENILVRNGADAIAAAIVELLRDPKRRKAMGTAARESVLAHYTWARKATELEALMRFVSTSRSEG